MTNNTKTFLLPSKSWGSIYIFKQKKFDIELNSISQDLV